MLAQVPCAYIADGHHRTASAMRVAREQRDAARAAGTFTGKEPFNFFLAVLFPASQLTILPYNRVVADRRGMTANELCERVRQAGFAVERADGPVEPQAPGHMGMYCEGTWYALDASEDLVRDAVDPVAVLDVTLLQKHVLEPILGIGDVRNDARIGFVGGIRGTEELERRAGADGVAFSMCATSVGQLLDVADAGLLMPPKSTWFEPKLRSGLFIHRIAPKR